MAKKEEMKAGGKMLVGIAVIVGLMVVATFSAAFIMLLGGDGTYGGNVAVIPIEGVLLATTDDYPGQGVATSDSIIDDIITAEEDNAIKAVVFLINSPGGSAVASDEIARAVAEMEKPSVAVIREVGASGAFWVATANDHVIANRMSITGSIGVISSYLSFGRFLEHWNVTGNRLVAGERKDIGTPFRDPIPEELAFLQEKLDLIHEEFIVAVAENRNMSVDAVRPVADGRILLGSEALGLGLIDALGGEQEALDWINATLGIEPVTVVYEHEPSLLDLLGSLSAQPFGFGSLVPAGEVAVPMAR